MQQFLLFLISFILSLIFTPAIRVLALRYGLVAYPRADRWHKQPTAILGGVAIYLAAIIPILFLLPLQKKLIGIALGASLLFFVGLIDDKLQVRPYTKLFTQIVAGCIAIFFGVVLALPIHNLLAIPLTLLWIVGVTNSFNLLDNIDGLAAGIAGLCGFMLFSSSVLLASNPLGIYALILAGAALGFLFYNFNPAKIFMGDSGSMFLGYCLAVVSISGVSRDISNLFLTMLIPVLILSVPIFDTIFVMIIRMIQGRPIFSGGRDHTSHHLVTLGLSQRKTVLLLYIISAACGAIAIFYAKLNIFVILAITFLAVMIMLFFGLFLFEGVSLNNGLKKAPKCPQENNKTIINTLFLHKRRMVEVLLDFVFICIAYYAAYFLRFEQEGLASNIQLINESLVWIILIKMSVFFIFGLYRGVWRYISISDLLTVFKVVTIGSIAVILFLTFFFRFFRYSRAVFFIDWILLLFLVSGSRVIFRVLGEFISRIREKGSNVLIFGAGDTGEMVIREIKRNKALNLNPVGFIDDDLAKVGNKIQGIAVLGGRQKIKELVQTYDIKEILIAIPSIEHDNFCQIANLCEDCGISYRKIKGILDSEDKTGLA